MSQPYDSRALGPDFLRLCGVVRQSGSPVETRCKRGREHTAIPHLCNPFSELTQGDLFVFIFKLFAQRTQPGKGLGFIIA